MGGRGPSGFWLFASADQIGSGHRCLADDELLVVLPEEHPLTQLERIPAEAICDMPFILLDKAGNRDRDVMQVF